jgi:class 3 adenylate cyclase
MSSDAGAGEAVGIRTFLIADLRGYTRYSDEHGDEAASALARGFAAITMRSAHENSGEASSRRKTPTARRLDMSGDVSLAWASVRE